MKVSKGKPKPKFHFSIVLLIIVATFGTCFYIYMRDNGAESLTRRTETTTGETTTTAEETTTTEEIITTPEVTEPVDTRPMLVNPVPEHERVSDSYFDSCAFVGDSIFTGLANYGFINKKQVFANIGMNIEKINTAELDTAYGEMTVHSALLEAKPKNLYIMLGTNGIYWLSNDFMVSRYREFIEKVQVELPDTSVYILSIPPVTEGREKHETEPITNEEIDSYNSELLKLADELGVNFVDVNTCLKNNEGKLSLEEAEKDGIHFKADTYKKMLDYILRHTVSAEFFAIGEETSITEESTAVTSEESAAQTAAVME